jgi:hypothetical protein
MYDVEFIERQVHWDAEVGAWFAIGHGASFESKDLAMAYVRAQLDMEW